MREEILDVLEKNSRATITDLAVMLAQPEEEIAKEISAM